MSHHLVECCCCFDAVSILYTHAHCFIFNAVKKNAHRTIALSCSSNVEPANQATPQRPSFYASCSRFGGVHPYLYLVVLILLIVLGVMNYFIMIPKYKFRLPCVFSLGWFLSSTSTLGTSWMGGDAPLSRR